MTEIHEAATNYIQNGFSVIPVKPDKKPLELTWKEYQKQILPVEDVPKKFNGATHMAIVCGEVSNNLEDLDLDDATVKDAVLGMIKAKHPDIIDKLAVCQTPYGYSIVYRCEKKLPAGHKIAKTWRAVDGPGEYALNNRPNKLKAVEVDGQYISSIIRIETRAEGNYFLVPPSPGYQLIEGELGNLQPISKETRDSIIAIAKTFDEQPVKEVKTVAPKDIRKKIPWPNHIFSKSVKCEDILEENGWTRLKSTGKSTQYQRPGGAKGKPGGEVFLDSNTFQPYSTNVHPLEPEHQYTSFDLLKYLSFDGDFTKASQAIADEYPVVLTPEELKEILEDNPNQLDDAYRRSGLGQDIVSQIALDLGLGGVKPPQKPIVIYKDVEMDRVITECDDILSSSFGRWGYYQFSEVLGRVAENNSFKPYNQYNFNLQCISVMEVHKWVAKGKGKPRLTPVAIPPELLNTLLKDYPDSSAPVIKGFASHPTITVDGDVIGLASGYENGVMFQCDEEFKVDSRSYKECYARIVELFCKDMLFKDKECGQALFVSMMLTALGRLGMDGGAPGYFITANEPGTGKSTLFEFVSRTVYGKLFESVDWGSNAEERRKEIVSYLLEGNECFLYDNIQQGEIVQSPQLAQALTAGRFKGRVLGKSEQVLLQAQCLFVFAGNNITMSTEFSSRLMTIELLANTQNPSRRKVSVNNITKYCRDNRVEAVGCLLKMLQEGARMPYDSQAEEETRFKFWDKIVRNPLLVETGIDIIQGFDLSMDSSEETSDVCMQIEALADVFGVGVEFTTKQVFLAIADDHILGEAESAEAGQIRKGNEEACRNLRDIMQQANALSGRVLKCVGNVLSGLNNRVSGSFRFVRHQTKSKKPVKHWIEIANQDAEKLLGNKSET